MSGLGILRSKRRREKLKDRAARLFLIVGGVAMLLPLTWMLVTALKDDHTVAHYPTKWTISLPSSARTGVVRFDAFFFVQEEFAEEDVAGFEAPGEVSLEGRGAEVSLTGERRRQEGDEAARMRLARAGESALELGYDVTERKAAAVRITLDERRVFHSLIGLNFWVHGDASGHELWLRLDTDRGTLVASQPWELDFTDWRELSCYFREIDRLSGMPLLAPAGAPEGGGAASWFDEGRPLGLQVRALELIVVRVPYPTAVGRKLTRNFRRVAEATPLGRYYWNTLLVAFAVTFGQVFTSSLAAYAFARLKFPGRDVLFFAYLATLMIPGDVILIPRFIIVQKLGIFDTFWAIIIPGLATAYGTFLLRQFFLTIPRELEEAAMIDGCGRWGIYWRIILPLAKPALATLTVISFIGAWNMFLWPLIVTRSQDHWVLQVGLSTMQAQLWRQYNLIMAGALIALVPAMIIFTSAQRAFREGIVLTGIKQ